MFFTMTSLQRSLSHEDLAHSDRLLLQHSFDIAARHHRYTGSNGGGGSSLAASRCNSNATSADDDAVSMHRGRRAALLLQQQQRKALESSCPPTSGLITSSASTLLRHHSAQPRRGSGRVERRASHRTTRIHDDPVVTEAYEAVPLLEQTLLPRGGVSISTQAVGNVQFGIPPETIKDSMQLGLEVPRTYIVPSERFCRKMGPALGINLAEFEFPAYFNFFVRQKRVVLIVDSDETERQIRSVFEETLLGPSEFRVGAEPLKHAHEDFDSSFSMDQRPDFFEEFRYFRVFDKSKPDLELNTDTLLDFCHFQPTSRPELFDSSTHSSIGMPPMPEGVSEDSSTDLLNSFVAGFADSSANSNNISPLTTLRRHVSDELLCSSKVCGATVALREQDGASCADGSEGPIECPSRHDMARLKLFTGDGEVRRRGSVESKASTGYSSTYFGFSSRTLDDDRASSWLFSKVKWLGEVATIWPMDATPEQIKARSVPRVEIFRMQSGTEYVLHDIDTSNVIVGKARFSGTVVIPEEIAIEGFLDPAAERAESILAELSPPGAIPEGDDSSLGFPRIPQTLTNVSAFQPPSFGLTVLGNSHGFDKNGSTSGYVLWINGKGIMIDPPPYSSATLAREGILPHMVIGVIITHCHADHDAGAFQKILTGSRISVITTPSIYRSFIRKYAALSGLRPSLLRHSHRYRAAIIGKPLTFEGGTFHFTYSLHTIPCIGFKVEYGERSMVFTGDHLNAPELMKELVASGVLSPGRAADLENLTSQHCDVLLHEAGAPPIHTPLTVLDKLPADIQKRLRVVHTSALPPGSKLQVAETGTKGTIRLEPKAPRKVSLRTNRSRSMLETDGRASVYTKTASSVAWDQKRRMYRSGTASDDVEFTGIQDIYESTQYNSVLRRLSPRQRRALQAIAVGPKPIAPGETLWAAGTPSECAYIIVAGSATFAAFAKHQRNPEMSPLLSPTSKKVVLATSSDDTAHLEELLSQRVRRVDEHNASRERGELLPLETRSQDARDDFVNSVLSRLYVSNRLVPGLTFGRGAFLCDTYRMVSGNLVEETIDHTSHATYKHHTSTLIADSAGCSVITFPKSAMIPFLDANPGLLLCLLGTEVVI